MRTPKRSLSSLGARRGLRSSPELGPKISFSSSVELVTLRHSDLFCLQPGDKAGHHSRRFDAAWARQRADAPRSFILAYHRAFGRHFWTMGLLELARVVLTFASPVLSRLILDYLNGAAASEGPAVDPARRPRPVRLPGPSAGSGRADAARSAA